MKNTDSSSRPSATERQNVLNILSKIQGRYRSDFAEWLFSHWPEWRQFLNLVQEAPSRDRDNYGYSALLLLELAEEKIGQPIEYAFVRDLGRLVIDMHPEFRNLLWRGEVNVPLLRELAGHLAERAAHLGLEDLSTFDDPRLVEFMVFPELDDVADERLH